MASPSKSRRTPSRSMPASNRKPRRWFFHCTPRRSRRSGPTFFCTSNHFEMPAGGLAARVAGGLAAGVAGGVVGRGGGGRPPRGDGGREAGGSRRLVVPPEVEAAE